MSVLQLSDGWGIFIYEGTEGRVHYKISHTSCSVRDMKMNKGYSAISFMFGNNEPWSCIWCGERVPQEVAGYWKLCASVEQEYNENL